MIWFAYIMNYKAREATPGCENLDTGIVKKIEWYLKKHPQAN